MKLGRHYSADRRGFTVASYVFLFSILIYCAAWRITRDYGAAGMAVLTLTTLPFYFYPQRIRLNPYLMAFCAITAIYVILSLLEVFDRSWTTYFDRFAIFRQGFYAIGLPLFVIAAESTSRHFREKGREGQMFILFLIFGGIIGPFLLWYFDTEFDKNLVERFLINSLINIEMLFVLAIGYFLIGVKKIPIWAGVILCLFLAATATHLQGRAAFGLLALFLIGVPPRLLMIGTITTMTVIILSLLPFGAEFKDIDPNVGVRIFMWQDAIRAFVDSNGIGIGFGTEYITNFYPYNSQLMISDFKREGFLYLGNHSTFFSLLMRMGVIGITAFVLFLFSFMPTKGRAYRSLKGDTILKGDAFLCWIYTVLVLSFASNVALASLNFFIGNAFVIGYLMSLKSAENPILKK